MRIGARAAGVAIAVLLGAASASAEAPTAPAPTAPAPTAPAPTAQAPTAPAPSAAPAQSYEAQAAKPPTPPDKFHAKTGELRAATLIGATVTNDQKQNIGTISDILIDQNGKVTSAVLSVGGFLGVGSRLVIVPFANLHVEGDRIVLPGATKVSLENLSAYQAGG